MGVWGLGFGVFSASASPADEMCSAFDAALVTHGVHLGGEGEGVDVMHDRCCHVRGGHVPRR